MQRRLLHLLSFVLIIAGSLSLVWLLQSDSKRVAELPVAEAISKIDKGEFEDARITNGRVEFTDTNGSKFLTTYASDATRELLISRINEFNKASYGRSRGIRVTEELDSAPDGWILLRFLPFSLLFIGIGLALGLFLSRFIRK